MTCRTALAFLVRIAACWPGQFMGQKMQAKPLFCSEPSRLRRSTVCTFGASQVCYGR